MRTAIAIAVVLVFTGAAKPASAQNLIQNPRFGSDLAGWTLAFQGPLLTSWSTADAYDSPGSGSADVDSFGGGSSSLSQCVVVQPGASYEFGGSVTWALKGSAFIGLSLTFHSDATCSSPTASVAGLAPPSAPFGGWTPLGLTVTSPPDGKSAMVELDASTLYIPGPYREPPIAYGAWDNLYLKVTAPPPPPMSFNTLAPCRLLDTREANGPTTGKGLPASSDRLFVAKGSCRIPSTAAAAALNVTVTQPTDFGDLRLYVRDALLPPASVINYGPDQTRANSIVVPLGAEGEIVVRCDQLSGTVHLIIDVTGYFE